MFRFYVYQEVPIYLRDSILCLGSMFNKKHRSILEGDRNTFHKEHQVDDLLLFETDDVEYITGLCDRLYSVGT